MTGDCLCGKTHPCPDHAPYIGTPYRPPSRTGAARREDPFNGFLLLRLLDEADPTTGHHQEAI